MPKATNSDWLVVPDLSECFAFSHVVIRNWMMGSIGFGFGNESESNTTLNLRGHVVTNFP